MFLSWDYYKADAILLTDIENGWLREALDWLIGEAGYRMPKICVIRRHSAI
jgi:hypothetical protein